MTSYESFKLFIDGINNALADFQDSVAKNLAYAEVRAALDDLKLHPSKIAGGQIQVFRPLGSEYEPDKDEIEDGLPGGLICQKVEIVVAVDPHPDYDHCIKNGTFGTFKFPSNYIQEYGKNVQNGKTTIEALVYTHA